MVKQQRQQEPSASKLPPAVHRPAPIHAAAQLGVGLATQVAGVDAATSEEMQTMMRLQARMRGFHVRNAQRKQQREDAAARNIQRAWRGKQGRKIIAELRELRREQLAVATLQATLRGRRSRSLMKLVPSHPSPPPSPPSGATSTQTTYPLQAPAAPISAGSTPRSWGDATPRPRRTSFASVVAPAKSVARVVTAPVQSLARVPSNVRRRISIRRTASGKVKMRQSQDFASVVLEAKVRKKIEDGRWRGRKEIMCRQILAWSFSALMVCGMLFQAIIYALKFGDQQTQSMIVSWLVAYGWTFAIVEPVQILILVCAPCLFDDSTRCGRCMLWCKFIYNELCAP